MRHSDYITLFEDIAKRHIEIRYEEGVRNSFFRINEEAEMQQALASQDNVPLFPAFMLQNYSGQIQGNELMVEDLMTGSFEIRQHCDDGLDHAQIEELRDDCKRIGMHFIAWLNNEQEENGYCGQVGVFDINSVRYDFTGPYNVNEYGCRFFLQFKNDAFEAGMDLATIFPES